jgi:hypothetical protein
MDVLPKHESQRMAPGGSCVKRGERTGHILPGHLACAPSTGQWASGGEVDGGVAVVEGRESKESTVSLKPPSWMLWLGHGI